MIIALRKGIQFRNDWGSHRAIGDAWALEFEPAINYEREYEESLWNFQFSWRKSAVVIRREVHPICQLLCLFDHALNPIWKSRRSSQSGHSSIKPIQYSTVYILYAVNGKISTSLNEIESIQSRYAILKSTGIQYRWQFSSRPTSLRILGILW